MLERGTEVNMTKILLWEAHEDDQNENATIPVTKLITILVET